MENFKFECDVWAVPDGTPIFPGEPIITVRGPVIQAQFVETMILLTINHQSLIATKANRIVRAAPVSYTHLIMRGDIIQEIEENMKGICTYEKIYY